ncbi:MAG: NAD-dependent epimerase/dehydratase family protein [Acidimicrobiia bacterium]
MMVDDDEVGTVKVLVTGGAGFIGSHLVDALVAAGHSTRVIDDLSTGSRADVHDDAELVVASILDGAALTHALDGVEVVFHLAAMRSVFRSVQSPLVTDTVNTHGTLLLLDAAHEAGVRRVVAVSSSSVYGGAEIQPTPEDAPLRPRSPYAVSKLAGEHYCRVFSELHGLETVSLRYFNVFGPRQRPDSAYAAVIPLFVDALRAGRAPVVHGDGHQSRDFTYVADAVAAAQRAADAPAEVCDGRAYNVAAGTSTSLLELLEILGRLLGVDNPPQHVDPRPGDVRHTRADPTAARRDLGFKCQVSIEEGLRRTVEATDPVRR